MEEIKLPEVINLNVGGKVFTTRLSTLQKYPDTMIGAMFSGRHNMSVDKDGNYFIDRNGDHFGHILDFLRDYRYMPPFHLREAVLLDADYFGLIELSDRLKHSPPLFPDYIIKENGRKALKNYDKILNDIENIATSIAISEDGFTNKLQTSVHVIVFASCREIEPKDVNPALAYHPIYSKQIKFQSCSSLEEILSYWKIEKDRVSTIFIDEADLVNTEAAFSSLIYDLLQTKFIVQMSRQIHQDLPSFANQTSAKQTSFRKYNFEGLTFFVKNNFRFTFDWRIENK